MVQTTTSLKAALDTLAEIEPAFAVALRRAGYPPPRVRDRGYATLLRTIMGQQVSVAAAQSIWNKLEAQIGDLTDPATVAAASDEQLRAAGLSRQKVSYARSLAEEAVNGERLHGRRVAPWVVHHSLTRSSRVRDADPQAVCLR